MPHSNVSTLRRFLCYRCSAPRSEVDAPPIANIRLNGIASTATCALLRACRGALLR